MGAFQETPPRPERPRRIVRRRDMRCVDQARVELGRASIGAASWCHLFGGLFGDPNAVLHGDTARVINFPARRVKSGNSDGRC